MSPPLSSPSLNDHARRFSAVALLSLLALPPLAAADGGQPVPTGSFLNSVKQAFKQDFDHEVVRGHFEVGKPPDAHRYYCLVDASTGKSEANGVGGQIFQRPDGMTGIKGAAVSFYSCATAEKQGMLVTDGYVLTGSAATANSVPAPAPTPAAAPAPAAASATAAPTASVPTAAPPPIVAPAASSPPPAATVDGPVQTEVMTVFMRFIAAQNAHDRAALTDTLLDSKDFELAQEDGTSQRGRAAALHAFDSDWQHHRRLDPQLKELHIANLSPGVALLVTPLLYSPGAGHEGGVNATPSSNMSIPVRWAGLFIKGHAGWQLASIFITPWQNWRAP